MNPHTLKACIEDHVGTSFESSELIVGQSLYAVSVIYFIFLLIYYFFNFHCFSTGVSSYALVSK